MTSGWWFGQSPSQQTSSELMPEKAKLFQALNDERICGLAKQAAKTSSDTCLKTEGFQDTKTGLMQESRLSGEWHRP
jgi:hypothetical protein